MGRGFTTVLLALLLLAAGLAIWRLCSARAPAPAGGGDAERTAPLQPRDAPDAAAGQPAAGAVKVWVEVAEVGRLSAPADLPLAVRTGGEVVAAACEWLGGVGGPWPRPDRRPGRALVRVTVAERPLVRVVQVPDGGGTAELLLGAAVPLRGRVIDRDGRPVAGARVWTGGAATDEVATDAEGRFLARVPGGDGIPVVVRAKGFAWHHRVLAAVGDFGAEDVYVLAPAAVLDVQLLGASAALPATTVRPVPLDEWSTELLQYPFFAVGLLAEFAAGADGRAVVDGLPLGARVGIVASGPDVPTTRPVRADLLRPRVRADLPVVTGPLLAGTVVDERQQPLAGARVWCWESARTPQPHVDERWLSPAEAEATDVVLARSAGDGAFRLARPGAGGCLLQVDLPGRARLTLPVPPAAAPLSVMLPPWRDSAAELVLAPPAAGAAWAARVSPFANLFVPVAADRPFVQRLPAPMLADLRVRVQRGGGDWSQAIVRPHCVLLGTFELATADLGR